MSDHHAGLGKEWVDGPGFVAWLYEIRPYEMRKPENNYMRGGKAAWADESDLRALYRAEHEASVMSLHVADRICVKLDIHIDSEMPEGLWVDKCPTGRKKERPGFQGLKPNPAKPGVYVRDQVAA